MKNTSAVQVQSSEKGEDRGKTYRIPISNGIFEHYPKLKAARWLLDLYIDWTTKEVRAADGSFDGIVLGGKPVSDADVARAFPVNGGPGERTIWGWRNRLARYGYITQKRTGSGYIITVKKSKKWPQSDPQKVATPKAEELQKLRTRTVKAADQIRRTCDSRSDSTRTRQGLCKEAEAPETGATPSTPAPNQSAPVLKDAWKDLGLTMPIGGVVFQGEWEAFYDQHPDADVHLVDVMEEFIQLKQTRGQKGIPPKFYDVKHGLEREAKEMDKEIEEAQRWAEANQRFEPGTREILKHAGGGGPRSFDQIRRDETDAAMRSIMEHVGLAPAKALPESSGPVILMEPAPAQTPALPELGQTKRESKELTPERQAMAERNILGIILRDPAALEQHPEIRKLEAGHFTADERHQVIFAGMRRMRREGKAITVEYLAAWLQGRGDLELAGGEGYVRALVDVEPARKAVGA